MKIICFIIKYNTSIALLQMYTRAQWYNPLVQCNIMDNSRWASPFWQRNADLPSKVLGVDIRLWQLLLIVWFGSINLICPIILPIYQGQFCKNRMKLAMFKLRAHIYTHVIFASSFQYLSSVLFRLLVIDESCKTVSAQK